MYLQVPVQFLPASLLITGQRSNPSFEFEPSDNPVSSADKYVDGDCGYDILFDGYDILVDDMSYEGGIVNALQNNAAYPTTVMNTNKH